MRLSCSGDWDRWVSFFAEGVAASALDSQQKVEGLDAMASVDHDRGLSTVR
jgi:hypothetical protein